MKRTRFAEPHNEGHANHERWLLTYADMITLLTAFFLMLYSMSVMSKGKFSQLATSVRSGFGGVVQGGGHILPGGKGTNPSIGMGDAQSKPYEEAMKNLDRYVEQHHLSGQITTRSDERGVVISLIADNMLFVRGQAQLGPNSREALGQVAQILKTVPNSVQIEGHTCDLPIHTAQFPSNWELSTARAGAVLRYFTEQEGLANNRFMAAGYAETHPLAPNTSETNRAHNRRVDVVILKSDAQREQEWERKGEIHRIIAPP
ncbi:MAG TPA: OmpA family protein [Chthonomonadaceae bacterium]|nr:OmpA family protein [Chthonomonadaceae bacterium]